MYATATFLAAGCSAPDTLAPPTPARAVTDDRVAAASGSRPSRSDALTTEQPFHLQPVGQFGGGVESMAADQVRRIAWVGHGPRVAAIDLHDPTAPRVLGQSPWLGSVITGLAVDGSIGVALTDRGSSLAEHASDTVHILDLTNPAAPHKIGGLPLPDVMVSVAIGHGHAYALRRTVGPDGVNSDRFELIAIDIRDPHAPRLVNEDVVPIEAGIVGDLDVVDVRVAGDVLAVTERVQREGQSPYERYRLHLLRLSNPAAPTPVRVLDDSAWCRFGEGPGADAPGMLYGYGYDGGIVALDVSEPDAPREVKRWPASVAGSSPCGPVDFAPFLVDEAGLPYLYQARTDDGAHWTTWLTAVGAPPGALGQQPTHRFTVGALAAALLGPHAVVAEVNGDFTVLDTRAMSVTQEMTAPQPADVVGRLPLVGVTTAIAAREDRDDGLLYAAVSGGLATLRLDRPEAPTVVGRIVDGIERRSLHVAGGLAAVGRSMPTDGQETTEFDEAEVIDVRDPTAPKRVAVFGGGGFARLLTGGRGPRLVHGKTPVFGPKGHPMVHDLDAPADRPGTPLPAEMRLLDGVTVGQRFLALGDAPTVRGGTCMPPKLTLWDVSDARLPRLEGELDLGPCWSHDMVVAATDRLAFVVGAAAAGVPMSRSSWLTIIAIDDPAAPHVLSQLPLARTITSMVVHDDRVFAAAASCWDVHPCSVGVVAIDVRDPTAPHIAGTLDVMPGFGRDVLAVRDGRVYVASSFDGVWVFEPPSVWPATGDWRQVGLPWVGVRR
ncbi:MAG: hypothetical protein ABI780_01575 [Ardenticatenales bacterium]